MSRSRQTTGDPLQPTATGATRRQSSGKYRLIRIFLLCIGLSASAARLIDDSYGQGMTTSNPIQSKESNMTDFRIKAYENYLLAWSAISSEERLRLLNESVTNDITFKNSLKNRGNIAELVDHLENFQMRSPGGSFRLVAMLGWEDNVMATWQLIDAKGQSGFTGYDILTFGKDEKIHSILMFTDVEKQKLK